MQLFYCYSLVIIMPPLQCSWLAHCLERIRGSKYSCKGSVVHNSHICLICEPLCLITHSGQELLITQYHTQLVQHCCILYFQAIGPDLVMVNV